MAKTNMTDKQVRDEIRTYPWADWKKDEERIETLRKEVIGAIVIGQSEGDFTVEKNGVKYRLKGHLLYVADPYEVVTVERVEP